MDPRADKTSVNRLIHHRGLIATGAALVLSLPALVRAGGFTTARFGGENATPTADQPTAIYYNPAALALGSGTRIYAEGLLAWRTASYTRPSGAIDNPLAEGDLGAGTPPDGVAANAGKATLANFIASPFLGVASDVGVPNLGVGLAMYVPFGGQSSWDENEDFEGDARFPGAVDGVQRWSTIEGELRAIYVSAAGAYRLPAAKLAFGASLSFVRQEIDTIRARTAQGTDDLVAGDTQVEGRSVIDVKGNSVAAALGVVWQPLETLWIGASYQSQPGFGETAQSGTLTNKFGSGATAVTDVEVLQTLPDVIRLGGRWRARPDVEVRLSFDWQRWGVFDNQCLINAGAADASCDLMDDGSLGPDARGVTVNLPRHWKDTYGVRGGGSFWVLPELELAGGLSFDTEAAPARYIDPSLMDMNKLIAHAGARYALLDDQLSLNLTLNNVFYFSREIEPRTSDAGFAPPSRVPDFAGTYELNVFYANLAAEYRF
jgi:long-chain fatty acid transport protein